MSIISGLQVNTAVKVGDKYVVCLPDGKYEIGGERVSVGYQNKQLVVSEEALQGIAKVTPPRRTVEQFEGEDGTIYGQEEVSKAADELEQYWSEDVGRHIYPSLEVEFEVRSRLDPVLNAKAIYKEIPEIIEPYQAVEVVGEMADTGSRFIEQSYAFGKANFDKGGVFKVVSLPVMQDELNSICQQQGVSLVIPTHSGLRYAKVDGQYVFSETRQFTHEFTRIFPTLAEAQAYEKECRDVVRRAVLSKLAARPISKPLLNSTIDELKRIESSVMELSVYSKHGADKQRVLKNIKQMIEALVEEAVEG